MSMSHVAKQNLSVGSMNSYWRRDALKTDDEVATNFCRGTGHLAGVEATDGFALRISPE